MLAGDGYASFIKHQHKYNHKSTQSLISNSFISTALISTYISKPTRNLPQMAIRQGSTMRSRSIISAAGEFLSRQPSNGASTLYTDATKRSSVQSDYPIALKARKKRLPLLLHTFKYPEEKAILSGPADSAVKEYLNKLYKKIINEYCN